MVTAICFLSCSASCRSCSISPMVDGLRGDSGSCQEQGVGVGGAPLATFLSLTPHTRLLMRVGAHYKKWGHDWVACSTSTTSLCKFGVLCSQPQPCPSPPCSPQPQRVEPGQLPLTWALPGPLPGLQLQFPGASSLPQRRCPPVTCPSSAAGGAGLAWPRLWGAGERGG